MKATLAFTLVLAVASTGAARAQFQAQGTPVGKDGVITRANLDHDEAWPLTIEQGTFVCEGEAVFVAAGGVQYPLNGYAKTLARTHPEHRRPLEDIWRRDEEATRGLKDAGQAITVVRLNITPVLRRGIEWCRAR